MEMLSDLVQLLLEKRGIETEEEKDIFLNPDYEKHLHDPFLLTDMEKAVKRILSAVKDNERIAVYADFDCDGIPAAVVLHDFFKKIGYENFEVYIPHRNNDGYGFHKEAIDTLAASGVKLIVTVDVGITAVDAAAHAKKLGVDVIVTDHHELNGTLPDAVAIINPKRDDYPFKDLCGAAVAYKLVQALITEGKKGKANKFKDIKGGWEKWLLDMVGIATIADMVPLVGENRVLAYWGLKVLRKSPRVGIVALCRKLRIKQEYITEDEIGFLIAPRINAASRMDEPEIAFTLLSTSDTKEAEEAASKLESLNRKRKGAVAAIVREAKKRMSKREHGDTVVHVIGDPKWQPSLLGLVANSIMDDTGGAVCVWGRDGAGVIKGSCRSDGSVHVAQTFERATESLVQFGGHECAGGFEVSHENIHTIAEALQAAAVTNGGGDKENAEGTLHEADVSPEKVSWELYETLSQLAPFGIGNPKPLFCVSGAPISDVRVFGKEGNHTEIILQKENGRTLRCFQFFTTPDTFSHPPRPGVKAKIIGTIERDTFNGSRALALRIVDVL